MLQALHIENIAVIRKTDIEFSGGFSVLTGETGAGKSILIDSIGFLLGRRGGRELLRSGTDRATVGALFAAEDARTLARLEALGVTPEEGGETTPEVTTPEETTEPEVVDSDTLSVGEDNNTEFGPINQ